MTKSAYASASRGANFRFCKVTSGPEAGKIRVFGIRGKAFSIEGHDSSIRLSAFPFAVIGKPPTGTIAAPIDSNSNYSYAGEIIIDDPCTAQPPSDTISLVVHHVFTPTGGGAVQELCEVIPKPVTTCPIADCTMVTRRGQSQPVSS
jgi:hypothetical protein